jgi:Zn-dependent protease
MKHTIPVAALGLLFLSTGVVQAAGGAGIDSSGAMLTIATTVAAFLVGIGFHEWAHAWTADRLGDDTPGREGRLSLNPLDHLDPLGTVMLVLACVSDLPLIGWGKSVAVNPSRFKSPREAMMKVALAGPLMNFFIAAATCLLCHGLFGVGEYLPVGVRQVAGNTATLLIRMSLLNLCLGVFNMIPIPPLDGAKVMAAYLPDAGAAALQDLGARSLLLFYILLRTGVLDGVFSTLTFGLYAVVASTPYSFGLFALVSLACFTFVWQLPRPVRAA